MSNAAALSKQQLIELVSQQAKELASSQEELVSSQKELAQSKDIIRQLEETIRQKDRDYLKLWRERFEARSERYIANPDQLRIDFGNSIKRRVGGYRNRENFKIAIYFYCGGLNLYPQ